MSRAQSFTRLTKLAGAAVAALLAATVLTAPAHAAESYPVNPGGLQRGADVRIPHIDRSTLVDGSVRIPLGTENASLIGKTPSGYLVGMLSDKGDYVMRITPKSRHVYSYSTGAWQSQVSSDGKTLAMYGRSNENTLLAFDVASGELLDRSYSASSPTLVGVEGRSVFFGRDGGTYRWRLDDSTIKRISNNIAYTADLSHALIAGFTKDPYSGGCSVLWRLGAPGTPIWRSCDERIAAFNPAGTKLATWHILADGLGPSKTWLRTITGRLLATFTTRNGAIGPISFESDSTIVGIAAGTTWWAWVRGWPTGANRASDLRRLP